MGNINKNISSNKYGELLINFNKSNYQVNETITGSIHTIIKSAMPVKRLILNLKIQEYSRIEDRIESIDKTNTNFIIVETFNQDQLKPGHYTFPFSFKLPEGNINPSCNYFDRTVSTYIRHIVTAQFEMDNQTDLPYNEELLLIDSNIYNIEYQNDVKLQDTKTIETYFINNKGKSSLRAEIKRFNYNLEESINFNIIVDNRECKLDCKEINVKLFQKIRIKAEDKIFDHLVLINETKNIQRIVNII